MTNRICYYVDETMTDDQGMFTAIIVEENEPGFYPSSILCGRDYATASAHVDSLNERLGITHHQAMRMVASSMAQGKITAPRHDEDGQPYLAYYRNDETTGFIWSGDNDDPVQVTREMGEPVISTFMVGIGQDQDTVDVLAVFKEECDRWIEVSQDD